MSTADIGGRRLRAGIVGGGRGAFIGPVHRMAAELDGEALIVAGALSSDPQVARESAAAWYLERAYTSYAEMAEREAASASGIDFVIIATPNHLHFPVARAFLERGIHVVCDKPLALSVAEGEELARLSARGTPLLALTHNYSGYPLVREARERVQRGELGTLRKVMVEYTQDWLMEPLESRGVRQALWRTDPARAGAGGCTGDIGTHAHHLLEYVSGLEVEALCADLSAFVPGRRLDDDANILLRMRGGAKGTLTCSQVACGEANRLSLRLYGSAAALEWHQEDPGVLLLKQPGRAVERLQAAQGYLGAEARAMSRLPPGHPEGYIEAFANIYRAFIADVRRVAAGAAPRRDYPGVREGVRGLRFVAQAVASSQAGAVWLAL